MRRFNLRFYLSQLNNISASFLVFLQFLFVLFTGMLLPDQTLGKPLKSQEFEQRDQNIAEGGLDFSHAVNQTSEIRGKRDLPDCSAPLNESCPQNNMHLVSAENGCEKGRYMCLNHHEAVCKDTFSWRSSAACNRNIGKIGKPGCFPVFKSVIIHTGKCVRQTHHCTC